MKASMALCLTIGALAIAALLYANGRARSTSVQPRLIPPPEITHQPVRLRVAHATNARFPRLSAGQVAETLALVREDARRMFAIELEFESEPVVKIPIRKAARRTIRRCSEVQRRSITGLRC